MYVYMYDCTHTYVVYIQLYMLLASTQCSPVAQVLIPVDHTLDRKAQSPPVDVTLDMI